MTDKEDIEPLSMNNEAELIKEALVRRIRDADRWQGKVEAWEALMRVIQVSEQMEEECAEIQGSAIAGKVAPSFCKIY